MKKILTISSMFILALILTGCSTAVTNSSTTDLYKEAPTVEYTNLLEDTEGHNLYYFYQETCAHCQEIKPDVTEYYDSKPEDIDFYLVDMAAKSSVKGWDAEGSAIFNTGSTPLSYSEVTIQGTPTLISMTDGTIDNTLVGSDAIVEYLNKL